MTTLATLATQLLQGLAFLHNLSIVHCDLKPENVCLVSASRRRFKIIDFGSAVLTHDCHNSYVQSRWYRAPEVMLGLPWDEKVDVWGVGCIVAELLLGQPIFHGGSVELVLAAQEATLGRHPQHMVDASRQRRCITPRMDASSPSTRRERRPERTCCSRGLQPAEYPRLRRRGLSDFLTTILSPSGPAADRPGGAPTPLARLDVCGQQRRLGRRRRGDRGAPQICDAALRPHAPNMSRSSSSPGRTLFSGVIA